MFVKINVHAKYCNIALSTHIFHSPLKKSYFQIAFPCHHKDMHIDMLLDCFQLRLLPYCVRCCTHLGGKIELLLQSTGHIGAQRIFSFLDLYVK